MSVKAYVKGVEDGIQKRIKENLDFAEANQYPKDELDVVLKALGPESTISKLYTLEGQTAIFPARTPAAAVEAKQQAEEFYPGLWTRLSAGQKGMNRLKQNTEITLIKPENELNAAFIKFINELTKFISLGAKIKIEDIFSDKTDNDTFEEYLDEFNLHLNTYGANDLIRPAFTELFNKKQLSVPKLVEATSSAVNATPVSTEGKDLPAASINSTTASSTPTNSATSNPINPTATKSSEPTSVTSLEGGVTSKTGELQTENILETDPSKAININLENKPIDSKPAEGSTSNSTTASATSNSTTVNDVSSASSVTGNLLNTSTNTGVTGDKNIMNVANTTNQSSTGTVNENKPEKEKGGFLSKVGNFAKKAGAVLNLPSIGTLGEQAKGLFGAAGANINSRISEVKESFAINSNKSESLASPTSSTVNNSVNSSNTSTNTAPNVLAVPNTADVSNTKNLLKTETQNSMKVEQKLPGVTATSTPAPVASAQIAPVTSTVVSNAVNSQTGSSPQTTNTNTAQNIQAASQPASNPPGMGVNVDMNQLAQSIMRLERILISGIDVTIKET